MNLMVSRGCWGRGLLVENLRKREERLGWRVLGGVWVWGGSGVCKGRHTYRSTNPCPTLYPKLSRRWNTASRVSSSAEGKPRLVISFFAVPSSVTPASPSSPSSPLAAVGWLKILLRRYSCSNACSRACRRSVILCARGTSSIKRKSRAEALILGVRASSVSREGGRVEVLDMVAWGWGWGMLLG